MIMERLSISNKFTISACSKRNDIHVLTFSYTVCGVTLVKVMTAETAKNKINTAFVNTSSTTDETFRDIK